MRSRINLAVQEPRGRLLVQYCDELWGYRWKGAITEVNPDIIEILTWNGYAKSSYIADLPPRSETGPGSIQLYNQGNYVYGMSRNAWRTMAAYYIRWYRADIDHVVVWYRTYPKSAQSTYQHGQATLRNSTGP